MTSPISSRLQNTYSDRILLLDVWLPSQEMLEMLMLQLKLCL